jgi:hypothetical protein
MVSNVRELFRRGARDETFGPEMGVISMLVKLEGALKGPDLSVMAGLRPGHWGEHLNPEEGPLGRVSKGAAALWFETREGALLTVRN